MLLIVAIAGATGCNGGGSAGSGPGVTATPAQMAITYYGTLRRCAAGTRCDAPPLPTTRCPAASRCVSPAKGAVLVRCPGPARLGVHCYALPPSHTRSARHGPWVILQQRDLSCFPARGGYADPAAACRALGDYLRRSHDRGARMCMCPLELWQSLATGTFRGRRVALDMAPCATCGMGHAAVADRVLLTPALSS
jgi:hypothetical protein